MGLEHRELGTQRTNLQLAGYLDDVLEYLGGYTYGVNECIATPRDTVRIILEHLRRCRPTGAEAAVLNRPEVQEFINHYRLVVALQEGENP